MVLGTKDFKKTSNQATIKILRGTVFDGKGYQPGDIVTGPYKKASYLVNRGKAEFAEDPEPLVDNDEEETGNGW